MTTEQENKMFEDLMGAARTQDVVVPEALLDRVMADADAVLAQATGPVDAPAAPRRPLIQVLLAVVGGWSAVGGLAAATVAGLWIGVSPPAALDTFTQDVWGSASVSVPLLDTDTIFGLEG